MRELAPDTLRPAPAALVTLDSRLSHSHIQIRSLVRAYTCPTLNSGSSQKGPQRRLSE